jgi:hypothetical protein
MPFKFTDLMVSVVDLPGLGDAASGSPCGCTDSGTATVGSCTSECVVQCGDSGEIVELPPYSYIDPVLQLELRQILQYALASSKVMVRESVGVAQLEAQMKPQSVEEATALEAKLTAALHELRAHKAQLQR